MAAPKYEVATTTVEATCTKRIVSGYLRKWFGVLQSFTLLWLYGNSTQ